MVLEYLPTKLGHFHMGVECRFADSSTMGHASGDAIERNRRELIHGKMSFQKRNYEYKEGVLACSFPFDHIHIGIYNIVL